MPRLVTGLPAVDPLKLLLYSRETFHSELAMYSAMQEYGASGMSDVSLLRDAPASFSAGAVSRVLLAIDDPDALESLALQLADAGVVVQAAPSVEACLRALARDIFDLLVIDRRLGKKTGLAFVRELRERGGCPPFVLVTRSAAVADAVDAMRLGARTVLDTSLPPEAAADAIIRELAAVRQRLPAMSMSSAAGGPARRWAGYVWAVTESTTDPRTLADWARAVGVSRTVLVESCARVGIAPRDARDLARVLRLVRRVDDPWEPEAALDVADRRTLRALLSRAGITDGGRPTVRDFLQRQGFVEPTNAGVLALRLLIDG